MAEIPESARQFMSGLIERARKLKKTIAFPEGGDPRVLEAAARLARDGVVRPVLIGPKPANAPEGVEFLDPAVNTRAPRKSTPRSTTSAAAPRASPTWKPPPSRRSRSTSHP